MCLRVLQVVGSMDRGGAETLLMNLYRKMNRQAVQFDFVVHSPKEGDYDGEIRSLGGKIYHMPHYSGVNHFSYVEAWERFFRSHPEYSIVHGHIRSTAAIYLRIAKKYGLITIAHSHNTASRGNLLAKFVKTLLQYPIRYTADHLFACSEEAGIWLFGKSISKRENFHKLNNAIDSSKFLFSEELRNKKRDELGVGQQFVIGHVGNFDRQKNHEFLIDVFERVWQKDNTCTLLLVGSGNDVLQRNIEEKVRRMGLESNVRFLGKRTDVQELLNAFDLFLFPSHHEGLPLVTIEAQSNGLMCLLSDAVSKEAAITQNVEFISLKKPAEFWADRVLSYRNNYERLDMYTAVQDAGYDINSVAQWLAGFYLELHNPSQNSMDGVKFPY